MYTRASETRPGQIREGKLPRFGARVSSNRGNRSRGTCTILYHNADAAGLYSARRLRCNYATARRLHCQRDHQSIQCRRPCGGGPSAASVRPMARKMDVLWTRASAKGCDGNRWTTSWQSLPAIQARVEHRQRGNAGIPPRHPFVRGRASGSDQSSRRLIREPQSMIARVTCGVGVKL